MAALTNQDKARFIEMLAAAYPKSGVHFAETPGGMDYITVTLKEEFGKSGSMTQRYETTIDRFIQSHLMPKLLLSLLTLDGIKPEKVQQKYLECINEIFDNALYETKPNTFIDYVYEAIFDEIKGKRLKGAKVIDIKAAEELTADITTPEDDGMPV